MVGRGRLLLQCDGEVLTNGRGGKVSKIKEYLMANVLCSNCGYECDELNQIELCQTCNQAYEKGRASA
jgi:hypothetical protein